MSPLTATKPKLGFAGIGWIGKNRLMAVKNSMLAEIKAVTDPDVSTIQGLNPTIDGFNHCKSFEAMLEEDIDGVVIATPSALHADQTLAALNEGKAVFCQKPLGRSERETAEVVNAARKQDLLLGVDFSYRHTRAATQLKEVVQSGQLGNIYAVELVFHNAYGPDKAWYRDSSLSGGGCLMDLGIHLIDLLFWVLEEAEIHNLSSRLFHQGQPLNNHSKQVEDYAAAQFTLNDDTVVQLSCSWNLPAGKDAVIKAAFYGENGGAAFRNVNGSFYDFAAEKYTGTSTNILAEPPDNWSGRAAVAWADTLAESNSFDPDAEKYIDVAHALDILYQNCS
jgi:predicted dehydrogenase